MKNFIDYEDINGLCGRKKDINEEGDFSDKSERENSKQSSFKAKAKNVWGKIKKIACVVITGLIIAKNFLKAVTGVQKEYKKMRREFA